MPLSLNLAVPAVLLAIANFGSAQPSNVAAAPPAPPRAAANLTAAQDHQAMMDLLHITSLRRGAEGNNPQSPYYQNTDESKANPYPNLPDPLVLKNGRR